MLDAVSLGEGRGAMLGVDEAKLRRLLLCAASLGTAAAVSRFGIVGFVGLVVPHLIRLTVGPAHRPLSLLCFLAGGTLLAAADGFAQRMGELPVGVLLIPFLLTDRLIYLLTGTSVSSIVALTPMRKV